jgi:hypothetical protein
MDAPLFFLFKYLLGFYLLKMLKKVIILIFAGQLDISEKSENKK